jgi:E3 ubiquitin-protein ligase MYCBP2
MDFCSICYVTAVGQEPSVIYECGHINHFNCSKEQVQKMYNGPRIVFNYLNCPDCK